MMRDATADRGRRRHGRGRHGHARRCSPSAATSTCARSRRRARPARACRTATTSSLVEEATPEALGAGDVDLFLFSVGTSASRALVPVASAAGAICVDKSSAYRLVDGYPLVVPEVNGGRALEALERDRIVANPNCCTIPLTCVLKPLHDEAGLARVRVSTYQSVSGAGAQRMDALAERAAGRPRPRDGLVVGGRRVGRGVEAPRGDAQDPRAPRPPDLGDVRPRPGDGRPLGGGLGRARASRSRRTTRPRSCASAPERARPRAAGVPDARAPRPARTSPRRPDPAATARSSNGLALYLSSDNLRKGAALNAIQIAEVLLDGARSTRRRAVRTRAGRGTATGSSGRSA